MHILKVRMKPRGSGEARRVRACVGDILIFVLVIRNGVNEFASPRRLICFESYPILCSGMVTLNDLLLVWYFIHGSS